MSTGDAPLAEALIEAHVGDLFSIATDPEEPMVAQWERLIVVLRTAGYKIVKIDDGDGASPDLGSLYQRIEPKLHEVLRRLAPKGRAATPELIAEVKAELLKVVSAELLASGVNSTAANGLANIICNAIGIKPR